MYFFFFFPVGTESRGRFRPIGTALLLAVLFGTFALRIVRPDVYLALLETSFRASDPHLDAAFLSVFLHASWFHLLGNALYLWIFGRQLEGTLTFVPVAVLLVGGGVVACYCQAWLTPLDSPYRTVPLVGASGGIAAILGATFVRFRHRRVRVLWFVFALLGGLNKAGVSHLNTIVASALWFALQLVHGLAAREAGGTSVAYAAHVGGFVAGALLAVAAGLHRGPRREVHLDRGREYFRRSDWYAACGELTAHLRVVPGDERARRMRARCLLLLGRAGEAASEYLDLLRDARQQGHLPGIASLLREMRTYGIASNLSERVLLRLAFDFQKAGHPESACAAYAEITARFPDGDVCDLATIRWAELLWNELGRYEEARACYERLLSRGRSGEWTDVAEARLRSMEVLTGRSEIRRSLPYSRSPGRRTSARPPS